MGFFEGLWQLIKWIFSVCFHLWLYEGKGKIQTWFWRIVSIIFYALIIYVIYVNFKG